MVSVRPAVSDDFPAIASIQLCCPEAAQWPVGDYLPHRTWVAFSEDGIIGFLALRSLPGNEWELLNLAVHPAARRRGIGALLLQQIPDGVTYLEVRESNRAARALYAKCGFGVLGTRKGYYQNPPGDAVVMQIQK